MRSWALALLFVACNGPTPDPADKGQVEDSAGPSPDSAETAETAETAHTGETAPETGESAPPETGESVPAETGDSAAESAEPLVEEESIDAMEDAAGWLFSDDEVHLIEIRFSEDAATSLNADPYSYVEGSITIDDMTVDEVGLRLKGKIGSYRPLSSKAAFKIDFNYVNPDQTFYGLKKLNLNNMVVDCSMLKEHMAYTVFRDMGLAAQRTGYAWVTVNEEPYGLYNILEQPNHELLERFYDDPSGNLYDGKYIWYGGWSYTLLDLRPDLATLYELEEGTDVANADLVAVANALLSASGTTDFYTTMGEYVDWDEVLTYWVVEQFVGHNDGYVLNRNNNFVYFDAADGKLDFVPWDMDYSHLNDTDWGMNWAAPYGMLAANCRNDATCLAAWKEAARGVVDTVDVSVYDTYLTQWAELIQDYAEADPRKECSTASMDYYQTYVRNFVAGRPTYLNTFWSLE